MIAAHLEHCRAVSGSTLLLCTRHDCLDRIEDVFGYTHYISNVLEIHIELIILSYCEIFDIVYCLNGYAV